MDSYVVGNVPTWENCTLERKTTLVTAQSGWTRISYKEWRPKDIENERRPVVICVHGLTRNADDFDYIAAELSSVDKFRVLSADVSGRGHSPPLSTEQEYGYPSYVRMFKEWMSVVLSEIFKDDVPEVYWVGTSMGGLIGMMINASVGVPLINRLVLNDIGPFVSTVAIDRLKTYCGHPPTFNNDAEVKVYLKDIYAPFEPLTDEQWNFMVRVSVQKDGDKLKMRYDPRLTYQLRDAESKDMDLYESVWNKIPSDTKILLIRGETSDILTEDTANKMKETGPGLDETITIPVVGHAPMLLSPEQLAPIRKFFLA